MLPRYMILDGGLGTELSGTYGHTNIDEDPLWSTRLLITHCDCIKKAHASFLASGADVIETATYQCSIQSLTKHLSISQAEAIDVIKRAVRIAKEAVDDFCKTPHPGRQKPLVAGSIGPYGACLADCSEYTGLYVEKLSKRDLVDWHRPRVKALLEAGVDLLAIDTIPAQKEAEALELLLQEFPQCRAWLAFSCKDDEHTCHGETIAAAVSSLSASQQIVGVGINCTAPRHIEALLRKIPDNVKKQKAVVVYANSGEDWSKENKWTSNDCPPVSSYIANWMSLGARWVGGCCRVTPAHITDIKQAMQAYLDSIQ